jgi:dihydropteroate synthase
MGSLTLDDSRTFVMGVVNVTPDSFSDGGRFSDPDRAIRHGLSLVEAGADILDVGGESTRPGAEPVSAREEKERVLPVIRGLASETDRPISIDTYKAEVAEAAVEVGAACINDISGLSLEPRLANVAARARVVLILGHIRGTPQTMQKEIDYRDCLSEVIEELARSIGVAESHGVALDSIIVDPGIGFGKTTEQNLELISGAGRIRNECGRRVLIGPSRKGFIGKLTGAPVTERLSGTLVACTVAVTAGADMVRVHDVGPTVQAMRMADAFERARRLSQERTGKGSVAL